MHESTDDQFSTLLQKGCLLPETVPIICGFISVKSPEQMNALLELSLVRHERLKNQREVGMWKQWEEKKKNFQILYFLKD